MLFWTGTANVENGSATVSVDAGPALTAEVAARYSMAVLDGIVYFVDSLTDTSTFELTRDYAGASGTVSLEIWPVSPEVSDLVRLAQVVARTQAQINVLDKNSQGLFYQMKGVTGAADPGPGFVAFDHGDAASVTEAYIDVLDANGRAVAGLLGLWEAGTTLVLRSLTTTAYRAYAVASFTDEGGWVRLGLAYLGHDGVLADNEALALSWTRAAAGLAIDATGLFVDRDDYDDQPGGFVFLSADGDGTPGSPSALYRKASAAAGDWGPAVPFQGPQGEKGWAPLLGLANDGARRVLRLTDYVGGEGAKPTGIGQYLSAGGLTSNIANAMDVRGPQGLSAYAVAVANGFSGDEPSWLASLVGASAYQVAVANGFVGDQASWLTSLIGRDGTDPGALFNWDDATADADPGAGKMRADNADLASAGFLFVSKLGRTSDSLEAFLLAIGGSTNTVKGHVTLTSSGGSDQAIVGVTGLVNAGTYVKIALQSASHSGAGSFPADDPVSLQFSRAGNQGAVDAISLASTINGATEKSNPVPADIALITDSEDGNVIKKVSLENLGKAISPPSGEVVAKSANYTVVEDDNGNVIAVDAAAAARTITLLPAAVAGNGFKLVVKKVDSSANIVTVDGDGSETIDGDLSRVLRMQNQSIALICDGAGWRVLGGDSAPQGGENDAIFALEIADLKGGRLGMKGGVADPFYDESGVEAKENAEHGVGAYRPTRATASTQINPFSAEGSSTNSFTIIDLTSAIIPGALVGKIGVYSASARSFTLKIAKRNSPGNYDIVLNEVFAHPGGGWSDFVLPEPFVVPSSGEHYLGAYTASGSTSRTVGTLQTAVGTNTNPTGSGVSLSENVGVCYPLRYERITSTNNMTLTSIIYTAQETPQASRISCQINSNLELTPNTDFVAEVSRDAQITWTPANLALVSHLGAIQVFEDNDVDVSGQPPGASLSWRFKTLTNKDIGVTGVVQQWR